MIKPSKNVDNVTVYVPSSGSKLSNTKKNTIIKLDWNEPTFKLPKKVSKKISNFIEDNGTNYYGDINTNELTEEIALYNNTDKKFILTYNGSDAAAKAICDTFIETGDKVLVREPVYTQPYVFIQANGGELIKFLGKNLFSYDLDIYKNKLNKNYYKMVYIVNPNNPTGLLYKTDQIENLIKDFPDTIFLIDEAYYEYAKVSCVDLVKKYHNLVVTRTFSKAFSLAGLRMGYIITNSSIMQSLMKIYNGKELNIIAQYSAKLILKEIDYVRNKIDQVNQTKIKFINYLKLNDIECISTPANFILIKTINPTKLTKKLEYNNVYVRDRSMMKQMEGFIRVSIGSDKEMSKVGKLIVKISRDL